jgi:orotate phosphoribosyltransferase-like protein
MPHIPVDPVKVCKLWDAGLSREQIASRVGLSKDSVSRILTQHGKAAAEKPRSTFLGSDGGAPGSMTARRI